jgi:hypothetical protein
VGAKVGQFDAKLHGETVMEERFNMIQAAKMIPYSKRNFLRLKSEGFFPPARINGRGQPYYTMADIERCRQLKKCGVGHNGVERNLYGKRSGGKRKANSARAKKPLPPVVEYVLKRLKDFGITGAKGKAEKVQAILRKLYPQGEPPETMATVTKVAKVLRPTPPKGLDEKN